MVLWSFFFFFKQKTAYEMRISDWSSDVCSSDLRAGSFVGPSTRGPRRERMLARPGGFRRALSGHRPARWRIAGRRGGALFLPVRTDPQHHPEDRKSVVKGKSVSVRLDLGGRRIIKKKKKQ